MTTKELTTAEIKKFMDKIERLALDDKPEGHQSFSSTSLIPLIDFIKHQHATIMQAKAALLAASGDIMEWRQLAREIRRVAERPDNDPNIPSEAGLAATEKVLDKISDAFTSIHFYSIEPKDESTPDFKVSPPPYEEIQKGFGQS